MIHIFSSFKVDQQEHFNSFEVCRGECQIISGKEDILLESAQNYSDHFTLKRRSKLAMTYTNDLRISNS